MTSSCGTSNVCIGSGFCSTMHGPAAGSLGRKKNQLHKRKIRSAGSRWRRCVGQTKVARSEAWIATADHYTWGYWVEVLQYLDLADVEQFRRADAFWSGEFCQARELSARREH